MKKLLLILMLSFSLFAGKQITVDKMRNVQGEIIFNYHNDVVKEYYAIAIIFYGISTNGNDVMIGNREVLTIGNPQVIPYTNKEIYTKLLNINPQIANKLKDLYLNAIDEDISI